MYLWVLRMTISVFLQYIGMGRVKTHPYHPEVLAQRTLLEGFSLILGQFRTIFFFHKFSHPNLIHLLWVLLRVWKLHNSLTYPKGFCYGHMNWGICQSFAVQGIHWAEAQPGEVPVRWPAASNNQATSSLGQGKPRQVLSLYCQADTKPAAFISNCKKSWSLS